MQGKDAQPPIIKFIDVGLSFGKKQILKGLSFDIFPEEIVTIAGPSGSGKSTILKLICGLLKPNKGEIIIKAKSFGMSFQYNALFNSMTVRENISLALKETTKLSKREIRQRVEESLETVRLENTIDMYPTQLSGGMQKRISIARALAMHPEILLYDEPSTGLDPPIAALLEEDMLRFRDELGFTSVVVTHDVDTIKHISDRVLILDKGYIVWQGTIEEFIKDDSPYPTSFRERKTLEELEDRQRRV